MSAVVSAEQILVTCCCDEYSKGAVDKVQIANYASGANLLPIISALCGRKDTSGGGVGVDVLEGAGIDHFCGNAYIVGSIPMGAAVIATIDVHIISASHRSGVDGHQTLLSDK